ncbi:MAG: outer membrane protein assembly factor BamD [Proteobacteria bacterium]|nr:outer membrane protein assembly factor BamD [Pseudomonadota bacterium]
MKRFLFVCIIALLALSSCAWFGTKEERPAHELASEGMDQFNSGDYKDAIESFEKLKDWYPFSKYAILAELKIADAHYRLEEYEEAIQAYENFESLHPRNEAIPYVIYQIGLCYFERIDTIDRDQSTAQKALDTFERLRNQFPKNTYAIKAEEHINKCLQSLAGHEFYVGLFYYQTKHYKAALHRFKAVLTKYPDVGVHQKALQYVAQCEELIKNQP